MPKDGDKRLKGSRKVLGTGDLSDSLLFSRRQMPSRLLHLVECTRHLFASLDNAFGNLCLKAKPTQSCPYYK